MGATLPPPPSLSVAHIRAELVLGFLQHYRRELLCTWCADAGSALSVLGRLASDRISGVTAWLGK